MLAERETVIREQIKIAKEPIVSCEQCGMCSSACPVTGVDDFNIRRIERAVQLGMVDGLVDSKLPWVCTTCGRCEEACPNGYRIMSTTRALRALTPPDVAPAMAACRAACPAGVDAPRYVRLIAEGKPEAAYAVVREKVPFPGILGRVCAHPCEEACRRGAVNQPIAICTLKRYAAEYGAAAFPKPAPGPDTGRKVAVVGAGPAGLTAAYYLRKLGHAVTMIEAREKAGGMMRYGIPAYRLPEEVLDQEIGGVLDLGIDLQTGRRLGEDVTLDELRAGYDAVLLTVGAQVSRKIKLEGGDHPDVLWGVEYLADVRSGKDVGLKERVVVVGGGNVAVDVALSALRTGAKSVAMACLESRAEMPAFEWELEEAVQEGVELVPSWGPSRILVENGAIVGIELVQCHSVFDDSGAFCPMFGEEKRVLEADQVILAIGQATDLTFLEAKSPVATLGGLIDVDLESQATAAAGVFAAGDAAVKAPGTPGTIINAIAAGRRVAASIDRFLGGTGQIDEVLYHEDGADTYTGEREPGFADFVRVAEPTVPVEERFAGFVEVARGFDADRAVQEAKRCLQCDREIDLARNWVGWV